ncbi:hypothetical protein [Corynebacterium efficiens YS-314]|uniref:ATPase AAA-type core domain-containing protein n=1 Tax=Corynebacterium efficiens (strain DSM 44549 / YS-314 / AJ 12310 / JCM 11189 / NBRC 100395) TaxID=196164 RepID=Q8FPP1_COREF|nr:hypothetical protein [Corynebacterium efficiens YS-314]
MGAFAGIFVQYDDAIDRVLETDLKEQVNPQARMNVSCIQSVHASAESFQKVSTYFKMIFGEDISFYDQYGKLGFILGSPLEGGSRYGEALNKATVQYQERQPKIWNQGLGMRSVLGLLLRIFAGDKKVILCDEPEAFLHPPQAARLGTVLAEVAKELKKQIFVATHDRNLLNGLTASGAGNVHVQRLARTEAGFTSQAVPSEALRGARAKSLIRYTPLLDSLFSSATILVENEQDAYFLSEAISHVIEKESPEVNISIDDFLFIGTGGKDLLGKIAKILESMHSNVIIACDFDILTQKGQFKSLLKEIGEWDDEIDASYENLVNVARKNPEYSAQNAESILKTFKNSGIRSPLPTFNEAGAEFLRKMDAVGVCINQVGELEDFDKATLKKLGAKGKPLWPHNAIEAGAAEGEEACCYAQRIVQAALAGL